MGDSRDVRVRWLTDAEGKYRIPGIYPGLEVRVAVVDQTHATGISETVRVVPGQGVELGTVELPTAENVAGRVVDQSGRPVEGAIVFAEDAFGDTTGTDAKGHFLLKRVASGAHRLKIYKGESWAEVSGDAGKERTYRLRIRP